jgi:indolepyruvate ferredoxin oxidoreductase beta subunit
MTGQQEHPGTGRRLDGSPTAQLSYEALARALGIPNVHVVNPVRQKDELIGLLRQALAGDELTVIVARQPCVLAARRRAKERGKAPQASAPALLLDSVAREQAAGAPLVQHAPTVNVKFAGLGGAGVVTASDILADVAFHAGYAVKKAEVHGMSQRGGSVASDVHFGSEVLSPMIPDGEADFLVLMNAEQLPVQQRQLRAGGTLITPDAVDLHALPNSRCLNTAILGVLSLKLPFSREEWLAALRRRFPAQLHTANEAAFLQGRKEETI